MARAATRSAPQLVVEQRPVAKLIPYVSNSRTHTENQISQVAASIKEFGWTNPILIGSDNVVIAGHARLLAAKKLDMKEVPVIVLDHLSNAQRKALIIADNRIALSSGWDEGTLSVEMEALQQADYDLALLGFDEAELEQILKGQQTTEGTEAGDAEEESHMRRITVTPEQYAVIEQTINKFRVIEEDPRISFGRGLELVCGDWLSGH